MTKQVKVRNLLIGGGAPVTVQSMTNTPTADVAATVAQIRALEAAGCDIVRLAIPNEEAALAIAQIREQTDMPLVADIHFDYRLALMCIERGIDKIRINPGNIGADENVRAVAAAARKAGIPIRIGINGGSLEKELLERYGHPCAEAMTESALRQVKLLEQADFTDIVLSLKASSVPLTIEAYRRMSQLTDYPLHIGVTEAGTKWQGTLAAGIGIGTLLSEGIGDTLRVSLTDDPVEEVHTGIALLRLLEQRKGLRFVSCPTCGRCQVDLVPIAQEIYEQIRTVDVPLHVAVMGCAVNGPGEAREADIGIACGKGEALLFYHGEIAGKLPEDGLAEAFVERVLKLAEERKKL